MTATLIAFAIGACAVIDGDTARCGYERIRLARIDAPELSEPGGHESANQLRAMIHGKPVTCVITGLDYYKRTLAECFVGEGPSLSDRMLKGGHAMRYRKECHGRQAECRGKR